MYGVGGTKEDKIFADRLMHFNIDSIIDAEPDLMDAASFYRSTTYYVAVRNGGDSSFNYH